jgi:hypothetical protein
LRRAECSIASESFHACCCGRADDPQLAASRSREPQAASDTDIVIRSAEQTPPLGASFEAVPSRSRSRWRRRDAAPPCRGRFASRGRFAPQTLIVLRRTCSRARADPPRMSGNRALHWRIMVVRLNCSLRSPLLRVVSGGVHVSFGGSALHRAATRCVAISVDRPCEITAFFEEFRSWSPSRGSAR